MLRTFTGQDVCVAANAYVVIQTNIPPECITLVLNSNAVIDYVSFDQEIQAQHGMIHDGEIEKELEHMLKPPAYAKRNKLKISQAEGASIAQNVASEKWFTSTIAFP